jgi:hypothetical protein
MLQFDSTIYFVSPIMVATGCSKLALKGSLDMGPPRRAFDLALGHGVALEDLNAVMLEDKVLEETLGPYLFADWLQEDTVHEPGTSWLLPSDLGPHGGPPAKKVRLEAVAQQGELAQRQVIRGFLPLPQRPLSIHVVFARHVMCDYTPCDPARLPKSSWTSIEQLAFQLAKYAPAEMEKLGLRGLKQMITAWFGDHPAFAGLPFRLGLGLGLTLTLTLTLLTLTLALALALALTLTLTSAWCKRLKVMNAPPGPRLQTYKVSFEYTPYVPQ